MTRALDCHQGSDPIVVPPVRSAFGFGRRSEDRHNRVYSAEMNLAAQRELVLEWLETTEARSATQAILRKWTSVPFGVDDLLNDAWLRLTATFDRRTEPYPDLSDSSSVSRFCLRVIDNLARDRMRSVRRRAEVAMDESVISTLDGDFSLVEQRVMLHGLIEVLGRTRADDLECPGCPREVVVATALEVVHLVLVGHDGESIGRTWMDRLMHTALDHVINANELSYDARNQRKSRCGRCVESLLSRSYTVLIGGSDE